MSERQSRESFLLPIVIPLGILASIAIVLFLFSRVLLSTSHHAATAVALTVAASVMGAATFIAARPRVTGSLLFSMVAGVAGVAMVAGGIAIAAIGPNKPEHETQAVSVNISAPSGAAVKGFDQKTLSFPANAPVNLVFANNDSGTGHNVYLAASKADASSPLFLGSTVTGPAKFTYAIHPLAPGTYYFFCNIHPTTMNGTLTVAAAPAGGGGGVAVTAHNLAFNTTTLHLVGGQATKIEFNNQDPGTQHNIGIYRDAGFTDELFKGEIVTGPNTATYDVPALDPGSYFFKCDIHPTMKGTVDVSAPPSGAPGSTAPSASASPT